MKKTTKSIKPTPTRTAKPVGAKKTILAKATTNAGSASAAKAKAPATDISATPKRKDRWPESVMKRGFTQIPSILLWGQGKLELKPDEFNVLLQLVSHWWTRDQSPHPSKESIARRMGKSPRMVQRHLTSLEEGGFIKRETRYKVHKGQDSNGYDLRGLVKKLKEIAPEFDKVADLNKRRRAKAETK